MFASGIQATISRAVAAARNAAARIKSYLGFSSPTEKGPGRDSHKWAPNLMNMLARGIEAGIPRIQAAASRAAASIQQGIQHPAATTHGGITYNNYTINNYNTQQSSDQAIISALRKAEWLYG